MSKGGVIGEPWFPMSRDKWEIPMMVLSKAELTYVSASRVPAKLALTPTEGRRSFLV